MCMDEANENLLDFMQPQPGREIHVRDWLEIEQKRIDKFTDATGSRQWIHTDPVKTGLCG